MTREETVKCLELLKSEIGKSELGILWHYDEVINHIRHLKEFPTVSDEAKMKGGEDE